MKSQDPHQEHLQSIISLYTQGQLQQALSHTTEMLERFPNSVVLYNIAGASNAGLLQFDAAIDSYKQAIKIKPDYADVYNNMGNALKGKGDLEAAIDSYKQAIKIKPDYAEAYYNMGIALKDKGDLEVAIDSYKQAIKIKPDYAEAYYNMGNTLKAKGDSVAAIDSYKQAIKIKPDHADAYSNMGNVLKDKGDSEAAIDSYKQALKIKPDYAEAYSNMGVALNDKGDSEAAIDSYKQALKIKPDYAEAYYNMGDTLKGKGDLEAAIDSYKRALKIKPDHADAYNNMGNTLKGKGDLEAAIDSYKRALKIKPHHAKAQENLISLLTSYIPQKENPNLIVKVNEEIRKIDLEDNISKIISDDQIVNLFFKSEDYISTFGLELRTKLSQVYRRHSSDNMNCQRHMSIFDKHDIIPEFCFGCYKVQVEPRSVIELIKLFIVFDQLELNENNTRKCMVELRPEISGFYKGIIYCSGLKQANQIAEHLDIIIKKSIGPELSSKVKRGCSEYPISYPNYKEINHSGPQLMNYNEEWKVIEESHDRKQSIHTKEFVATSLAGLNLSDVLIIRKWIDYARGAGDLSADLLNQDTVYYQDIYDLAKARLNLFDLTTL
jgi:tetratricopeptide (TPR) repeat protein